jgi:hypothetical protein
MKLTVSGAKFKDIETKCGRAYSMKVLGTEAFHFGGKRLEAMRAFGYVGTHGQFRIICKCKSMADANRKCAAAGLGEKIFRSDWCCETGNATELAICEQSDIAFCVDRSGHKYVTLEQFLEKLEELENAI